MKKLLLLTATASVVMASSSLPVQANTKNYAGDFSCNKKYVIAGQCADAGNYMNLKFSDFGKNLEEGIWNNCPVIIFPSTNNPGCYFGETNINQPGINAPETGTSETDENSTEIPSVNENLTADLENESQNSMNQNVGNQQNNNHLDSSQGNNNQNNNCPVVDEFETNVSGNESMGTDGTNSNRPIWNIPGIIIQIPCRPGTNGSGNKPEVNLPGSDESETTKPGVNLPGSNESETTKPGANEQETTKPNNNKPNNGGSTSGNSGQNSSQLSYAEQVVKLVNQERAKAGIKELTLDKNIEAAALIRAKETEISFSHTRPNGSGFSTVLKENGISFRGAGENIAWGQSSPEAVMKAWMNSEGHRANILNSKYTKIGVGYYQNSAGRKYWTQLFTY